MHEANANMQATASASVQLTHLQQACPCACDQQSNSPTTLSKNKLARNGPRCFLRDARTRRFNYFEASYADNKRIDHGQFRCVQFARSVALKAVCRAKGETFAWRKFRLAKVAKHFANPVLIGRNGRNPFRQGGFGETTSAKAVRAKVFDDNRRE